MNKIFTAVSVSLLALPMLASAEMTKLPSQHPVYSDPSQNGGVITIIGYISNIDWDAAQAASDARNGQKLPVVSSGQTVTDEAGVTEVCPTWYGMQSCVSLVKTPAYRANMINIAKTIISAKQESAFPRFLGWFKLAK